MQDQRPFLKAEVDIFPGMVIRASLFSLQRTIKNWKLEAGSFYNPPNCSAFLTGEWGTIKGYRAKNNYVYFSNKTTNKKTP